jgi:hypothetical protein
LLDILVDDVTVVCVGCGAQRQLWCLTGLKLFKHRLTYSSAGAGVAVCPTDRLLHVHM